MPMSDSNVEPGGKDYYRGEVRIGTEYKTMTARQFSANPTWRVATDQYRNRDIINESWLLIAMERAHSSSAWNSSFHLLTV